MHRFAFSLFFVSIAAFAQSSETIPFRAIMLPQNEVPAVNIAASGTATVWLHVVRDARGQVVSASTDFDVSYRFPGEVQFTGLHIHKGRSGENGPVTIDSGIRAAQPVASEGTGRTRLQGFTAPDNAAGLDTVNGMLTDPSGFYVNMHTTVYPGGAFRAQLQRAEMTVLISQLSPLNEVPAITDIAASGLGSIVALMTRDGGGNVSSGLVIFDANYTGLPEGTTFTGFHLHDGVRGVNGPVTINTGIAAGANSVAAVAAGGNLHYEVEVPVNNPAAVNTLTGIFSRPGQFYMNLHTSVYPGGVMRNQLRTTDTNRYQVNMSSANEVPPAGVTASAPSVFQAHTVRNSAGAIEAAVAIFDVNYRMPGMSTFTGLHIHNGKAGENGPVTVDSGLNARTPVTSDSGNGNLYRIVTVNTAMALAALNSATSTPDLNYLNLHTTTFPGGIVRSQLAAEIKTTPSVNAVISAVSDPALRRTAPGSLVTIFGSNMSRVIADVGASYDGATMPTSFNGVSAKIGDVAMPIVSMGEGYIVAQVPFEVTPGTRPLSVSTPNGSSAPLQVEVAATAPAIFFDAQGGLVTDLAFQLTGRAGSPATKGQYIMVYSTGLAPAEAVTTGKVNVTAVRTRDTSATIDGRPATVLASVISPGYIGLYQTYVLIPSDTRSGTVPLQLRSGEGTSNTVNILVQ